MTPELKAKWIAGLRSGKYKQSIGLLRSDVEKGEVSFCCMGVLCEAAGVPRHKAGYRFEKSLELVGVPDSMIPVGSQARLVIMNDHEEKTFSEIADWIEANVF